MNRLSRTAIPFALLLASSLAHAQTGLTGVIENYFRANRPAKGIAHKLTWVELRYRINDQWKAVSTLMIFPADAYRLDANYLEYDGPDLYVRLGRMRSSFGFAQWSDTDYNVTIRNPLIRSVQLVPSIGLTRFDIGAEAQVNRGIFQLTVGAFDIHTASRQMVPKALDHLQARFQAQLNNLIVGVNGLAKGGDVHNSEGILYGIDVRWTVPHFVVRGELVRGVSPLKTSDGYYIDVTYRLPSLTRTQFGWRNEASGVRGTGKRTVLDTIGLRQILGPALTFNLNYTWGSTAGSNNNFRKGWAFQTVYFIHF